MPIPDFRGLPVVVTGAAGFIGSHLIDALLEREAQVRALDNLATGRRENLSHCLDRIDFLEGDTRDPAICERACRGAAFVFHQAALGSVPRSMSDPATTLAVNVSGTANVFAAARSAGVRRVVYASSSSVYGDSELLPKREGREGRPLSPYALSKRMNEELADVFGRCFGVQMVGLRYFNVYGPRQDPDGPYAAVLPRFFQSFLSGAAPVIYGDGEQSRDFTFVSDAVSSNLLAAGAPADACGRAYNIAAGRRTTVNQLANAVRKAVGGGLDPVHQEPRKGDVQHSLADISLAEKALGFVPRVGLEDGIARTVRHYAARIAGSPTVKEPAVATDTL
jgi:nucleoside-diphosphate-sugar epimerase